MEEPLLPSKGLGAIALADRGRQSELGAPQFTRCQMQGLFFPHCRVMPDILCVCYTGIGISHLSESEGQRVILNKAREHPAMCSQNDFFFNLQVEMTLYLC